MLPSRPDAASISPRAHRRFRRGNCGSVSSPGWWRAASRWSSGPGRRLALRTLPRIPRAHAAISLFFLPSAVPSVSVGLGLLVAFSRPPVLLNGTVAIVLHRAFRAGLGVHFGNVIRGPGALVAGIRAEWRQAWGRGRSIDSAAGDAADACALPDCRLQPQLRAVDGRAWRDGDGLSAGLVDACRSAFSR